MARRNTFRKIDTNQLRWHPELGEGDNYHNFGDWLYFDCQLEGGYTCAAELMMGRPSGFVYPELGDKIQWPWIEMEISTPNGESYHGEEVFSPESFKHDIFHGAWDDRNIFKGRLGSDGMPEGYELRLSIGDIGVDLTAKAVSTGIVCSDEEHGYSYFNPIKFE